MGAIELFPNLPPAAATHIAAKLLNKHSPHEIAEAIEVLIDVLDMLGGDPDREDATDLEDDFSLSALAVALSPGPGCKISDPGEEDDPSGQCDEDGINTVYPSGFGAGCVVADEGKC